MTRTSRIALIALTACAIAAPAASADPRQDLRNPDQRASAPAHQDLRNPDQRAPVPVRVESVVSNAVDDTRGLLPTQVEAETPSGFAWGDAGIGAGIGAALVLSISGAAVSVRRHRRRATQTAIA